MLFLSIGADWVCPEPDGLGACVIFCSDNTQCTGDELCCSNGCGRICTQGGMWVALRQDLSFRYSGLPGEPFKKVLAFLAKKHFFLSFLGNTFL